MDHLTKRGILWVTLPLMLAALIVAVPFEARAATICFIGDCASNVSIALSPFLDTTVAIPGGTATFTSFPTTPSISQGNLVFTGAGVGQQGIYLWPPTPIFPPGPVKIGDLNTVIPGGVGTFTSLPPNPLISGLNVTFVGTGAGGQSGVYFALPTPVVPGQPISYPPQPIKIADLTTTFPGGADTFASFAPISYVEGATVLFGGSSASQDGLFTSANGVLSTVSETPAFLQSAPGSTTFEFINEHPPNPIRIENGNVAFIANGLDFSGVYLALTDGTIVNVASTVGGQIPETASAFQSFSTVSYDGTNVAFVGSAGSFSGVLKALPPGPVHPPVPITPVADTATPVPGGIGTFLGFGSAVIDPNVVVFEGFSSDGAGGTRGGLYTDLDGKLSKIVAEGDVVNGKTIAHLSFGPGGFADGQVAYAATFTDGTSGVGRAAACAPIEFRGFEDPIGGADDTGGTFTSPLKSFKLRSTIPVKMALHCGGLPVTTGAHTIQLVKFSSTTTSDPAIDATPTDEGDSVGSAFHLDEAAEGEWRFNVSTKSLTKGVWQIRATLSDGSGHSAFIQIK